VRSRGPATIPKLCGRPRLCVSWHTCGADGTCITPRTALPCVSGHPADGRSHWISCSGIDRRAKWPRRVNYVRAIFVKPFTRQHHWAAAHCAALPHPARPVAVGRNYCGASGLLLVEQISCTPRRLGKHPFGSAVICPATATFSGEVGPPELSDLCDRSFATIVSWVAVELRLLVVVAAVRLNGSVPVMIHCSREGADFSACVPGDRQPVLVVASVYLRWFGRLLPYGRRRSSRVAALRQVERGARSCVIFCCFGIFWVWHAI